MIRRLFGIAVLLIGGVKPVIAAEEDVLNFTRMAPRFLRPLQERCEHILVTIEDRDSSKLIASLAWGSWAMDFHENPFLRPEAEPTLKTIMEIFYLNDIQVARIVCRRIGQKVRESAGVNTEIFNCSFVWDFPQFNFDLELSGSFYVNTMGRLQSNLEPTTSTPHSVRDDASEIIYMNLRLVPRPPVTP